MFKPKESNHIEYEFVSIDELVSDDPLLCLIDKYIDFSFLLEKLRPFYSDDNGRPTDPLILFKLTCMGEHKEKIRLNCLSKSGKMLFKFRNEKIE